MTVDTLNVRILELKPVYSFIKEAEQLKEQIQLFVDNLKSGVMEAVKMKLQFDAKDFMAGKIEFKMIRLGILEADK